MYLLYGWGEPPPESAFAGIVLADVRGTNSHAFNRLMVRSSAEHLMRGGKTTDIICFRRSSKAFGWLVRCTSRE
jgi:hypothetical protein